MNNNMNEFNAFEQAIKDNNLVAKSENDNLEEYEEQFTPPDNLKLSIGENNIANMEENNDINIPEGSYHDHTLDKETVDKPIQHNDGMYCPGGPLNSEISSWKKQFGDIWVVDDLPTDQIYIYRDINRYEYKEIMAMPNTDPLAREEKMCEMCVLFPYEYSYGIMADGKAGIPSVLAEHIRVTSGFTKASMPRRL